MVMMAMAVMDWGWREHLSQHLFLQFPIDGSHTPAALLSQRWAVRSIFYRRKANVALVPSVILRVRIANPRIRCRRAAWWQAEKVLRDDVTIVLEHNLRNRRGLLGVTDDPRLIFLRLGMFVFLLLC